MVVPVLWGGEYSPVFHCPVPVVLVFVFQVFAFHVDVLELLDFLYALEEATASVFRAFVYWYGWVVVVLELAD